MSAQEQVAEFVAKVVKNMGLDLQAQVETTVDGTRINLACLFTHLTLPTNSLV
jgi:hypothetical protein